jgi:hypothetical protein
MKSLALLLLLVGCVASPPAPPPHEECLEKILYRDVVVLMPCRIDEPSKGAK